MNNLVIHKYGGSCYKSESCLLNIAEHIKKSLFHRKNIAVVISAQFGITNQLLKQIVNQKPSAQTDKILASGEKDSARALTKLLNQMGIKAKAFDAYNTGITTDRNFGYAKIQYINPSNLLHEIENGIIPIIAGFQGLTEQNEITTLGRGGSDLTAVCLGRSLQAERVVIYKQLSGLYFIDPNLVPNNAKLTTLSLDELVTLTKYGLKAMNHDAAIVAKQHNLTLEIASIDSKHSTKITKTKVNHLNSCTAISVEPNIIKISCTNKKIMLPDKLLEYAVTEGYALLPQRIYDIYQDILLTHNNNNVIIHNCPNKILIAAVYESKSEYFVEAVLDKIKLAGINADILRVYTSYFTLLVNASDLNELFYVLYRLEFNEQGHLEVGA